MPFDTRSDVSGGDFKSYAPTEYHLLRLFILSVHTAQMAFDLTSGIALKHKIK